MTCFEEAKRSKKWNAESLTFRKFLEANKVGRIAHHLTTPSDQPQADLKQVVVSVPFFDVVQVFIYLSNLNLHFNLQFSLQNSTSVCRGRLKVTTSDLNF